MLPWVLFEDECSQGRDIVTVQNLEKEENDFFDWIMVLFMGPIYRPYKLLPNVDGNHINGKMFFSKQVPLPFVSYYVRA